MEIRRLEPQDLDRCAQLYAEIFSASPHNEGWTLGAALARLSELLSKCDQSCFVAQQHDRIVGFAFCSFHTWWVGKVMRVEELCVDFRLQRHGIGTILMEHCLAAGRGQHGTAAVEVVTPRTEQALEFYAAQGFRSAGREVLTRPM